MKDLPQNEKYWLNEPGKMAANENFSKYKPSFNNNRDRDNKFKK
jgi:hypothetical protein